MTLIATRLNVTPVCGCHQTYLLHTNTRHIGGTVTEEQAARHYLRCLVVDAKIGAISIGERRATAYVCYGEYVHRS